MAESRITEHLLLALIVLALALVTINTIGGSIQKKFAETSRIISGETIK